MAEKESVRLRELAEFLRTRRERITPEEAGLPRGSRRRTPGLRREEVAALAGVGVTWYTWLEQGRSIRASAQVLAAIARTLRLDEPERTHLFTLAGAAPPQKQPSHLPVPSAIEAIVRALPYPTYVVDGRWNILTWNAPAAALLVDFAAVPERRRNIMRLAFSDKTLRDRMPDWDTDAARHVAMFRAAMAAHAGDPGWQLMLDELLEACASFREVWNRHEVAQPTLKVKRFWFPEIGTLRLEAASLAVTDRPECRMIVYSPADAASAAGLSRLTGVVLPPGAGTWGGTASDGRGSAPGEQAVDGAVEVEVIGLAATRNHRVRAAQEPDQDAARDLEQGVAVG